MNLPSKQQAILDNVRQNGSITSKRANEMLAGYYYRNGEKYVGEILSRMVKSGKLVRIKPGLFELGSGRSAQSDILIKNQNSLF